jgi:hypothetical protein
MKTDYYIREFHAGLNPSPDEERRPTVQIQLTPGEPDIDDNKGRLTSIFELKIAFCHPDADHSSDEIASEPEYGTVTVEFLVVVEDELDYLAEQADAWENNEYENVDLRLISAIEEDIVPKIFIPIELLVGNDIKGIVPRFRFTVSSEETE